MANLIEELPDILRDFYEYQELLKAEDPEFDLIDDLLLKWRDNRYPKDADEDGIQFFEDLLDLTPAPTDTLEERRFRVLTRLNARLPYTEIQLRKMLAAICGWDGFSLTVSELVVLVSLAESSNSKIRIIYEMLLEVIPMNLLIEIHQLLESYGVLYTAAATELGTTLVLYPWQQEALKKDLFINTAAAYRLGTKLEIYPSSGNQIDGYITIAAPGVIRSGVKIELGV